MNKRHLLIATLSVMTLLYGCSSSRSNQSEKKSASYEKYKEPKANRTAKKATEQPEASNDPKNQTTVMQLNTPVTLPFAEFTFTGLDTQPELYPSDTSGAYMYMQETEGKKYIYLDGTIKNDASMAVVPGNSIAQFVFDDKYTITSTVETEAGGVQFLQNVALDPFDSTRIVIYAQVADDLVNSYKTLKVTWGFDENFDATDGEHFTPIYNLDDAKYKYEFDYTK